MLYFITKKTERTHPKQLNKQMGNLSKINGWLTKKSVLIETKPKL